MSNETLSSTHELNMFQRAAEIRFNITQWAKWTWKLETKFEEDSINFNPQFLSQNNYKENKRISNPPNYKRNLEILPGFFQNRRTTQNLQILNKFSQKHKFCIIFYRRRLTHNRKKTQTQSTEKKSRSRRRWRNARRWK